MSEDDDFLSRWSRRKRARPVVEDEGDAAPSVVEPPHEDPIDETEEEALQRLGLPDPDTLGAGADFRRYLVEGVPQTLRRRALRRLWVSDPLLANLDGLNDYDEDFAAAAMTPDVVSTAYKVGKGFVRQVFQAEEDAGIASAETEAEPSEDITALESVRGPEADQDVARHDTGHPAIDVPETLEDQGEATPIRPRRMRFDVS